MIKEGKVMMSWSKRRKPTVCTHSGSLMSGPSERCKLTACSKQTGGLQLLTAWGSLSSEANSCLASQEFSTFQGTRRVITVLTRQVPVLSQANAIYTYLFNINFNIILTYTPRFPSGVTHFSYLVWVLRDPVSCSLVSSLTCLVRAHTLCSYPILRPCWSKYSPQPLSSLAPSHSFP
jgi:hypothetical protein